MVLKNIYLTGLICASFAGCSVRQAEYSALAGAAAGGITYGATRNVKDAAIGGLGGAFVGDMVGQWQDKSEKGKEDKRYEDAYKKAKLDLATANWNTNTGKAAEHAKQLVTITLPKHEENGVIYDERQITLEDYQ